MKKEKKTVEVSGNETKTDKIILESEVLPITAVHFCNLNSLTDLQTFCVLRKHGEKELTPTEWEKLLKKDRIIN